VSPSAPAARATACCSTITGAKKIGLPLPSPQNLNAPTNTFNSIQLVWSNAAVNAVGFKIERSVTATGPWMAVGVTNSVTSYADTGLSASTTYLLSSARVQYEGLFRLF